MTPDEPRTPWRVAEPMLRAELLAALTHDPQYLLMRDGNPYIDADVILARLEGFDEQVVDEIRLSEMRADYLVPLRQRMTLTEARGFESRIPVRRFAAQNAYANLTISAESITPPDDVKPDERYQFSVALVIFREQP